MNTPTILPPAAYRRMPWRNGGGTTCEIATHPAGADLASFVWRASVAEVARSGPFSAFPGVDRILVLLDGAGVRLSGAAADTELHPHDVLCFAGDEPVDCALLDGPVRDFNLMLRRGRADAVLLLVREGTTMPPARFALCHAAQGDAECTVGDGRALVREGSTLVADVGAEASAWHVRPCSGRAVAIAASIGAA